MPAHLKTYLRHLQTLDQLQGYPSKYDITPFTDLIQKAKERILADHTLDLDLLHPPPSRRTVKELKTLFGTPEAATFANLSNFSPPQEAVDTWISIIRNHH